MSTAIDEIGQLTTEVKTVLEEADQLQQQADEKKQQADSMLAKIRDLANSASGDYQVGDAPVAPVVTAPAKKRGRPKGSGKKTLVKKKPGRPKGTVAKKKPGRPKGSGKKPGRPKGTAKTDQTPLREVVWSVLSRSKKSWRESLPDLPADADGLKAVEIALIIEAEELWASKSKAANTAQQISTHIKAFREAGKMERGEGARYHITKGAKLED